MIYFTSDHHFSHENIIKYCDRPFPNAYVMDRVLISRYNETVKENDTVYFLGDLSMKNRSHKGGHFRYLMNKLHNGTKHLILGNHDKLEPFDYVDLGFQTVHTSLNIDLPYIGNVWLVHDPAWAEMDKKKLFLCGHVHTLFK